MRFHVIGMPHTVTNMQHSACAFTMKILHFCQMMHSLGHEVFHYGVEGAEVPCLDLPLFTKAEQEAWFGPYVPNQLYNVEWSHKGPYWAEMNRRAATAIKLHAKKGDFVCCMAGSLNQQLEQLLPDDVMIVEYGIGYNGTFAKYRVFESYAHMHKVWGAQGSFDPDGKFYDAVIPNYLNPADYPYQPEKEDYYLYLGRLIQRKGIDIAVETCKAIGARLVVAGQGAKSFKDGRLVCEDGMIYDNVEYVGFATGQKRADLFGKAKAIFVPTKYIEPFGAVAIEAQMAGTPAITTDFGAFTETVEHGRTGFRCSTLSEFIHAARYVGNLDSQYIHERSVARYSMDAVRWRYQTYFERLQDLWDKGWYTLREEPDTRWLEGYENTQPAEVS